MGVVFTVALQLLDGVVVVADVGFVVVAFELPVALPPLPLCLCC